MEESPAGAGDRRGSHSSSVTGGRRLERAWSGTSGGSEGGLSLPPGVRPPSASRVRHRQGIALRSKDTAAVVIKAGTSREDKAATRIASLYRGHSSRRVVQGRREEESAVRVQAAYRGFTARAEVTRRRQEKRAQALLAAKAAADKAAEDQAAAKLAAEARRAEEEAEAERLRQEALERERLEEEARTAALRPPKEDPALKKQLEGALSDLETMKDQVDVLNGKLGAKEATLKKRDQVVDSLTKQLASSAEDAKHKDEQLTSLANQISAMADVLRDRDKTKAAMEAQVSKLEARVLELEPPDTADVGLDAKPIDDSVFLQERDRIIERQAEEVQMLEAEVAKLMGGIDKVEDQVDVMQNKVVSRDELYAMKKKETEELRLEISRLEQMLKEASAREFAMDMATKQNEDLLKAVQIAELDRADALETRDESKRLYAEMEDRHMLRIKEAAEATALAAKHERDARLLRLELTEVKATVDARVEEVATKLDTTSKTAAVRLETMAEELRLRREKQYELLDKIRVLEEAVEEATNQADSRVTTVQALQRRNLELEGHLAAARKHREEETAAAKAAEEAAAKRLAAVQANLEATTEELRVVKSQMTEMSASVVRLAEKERAVQEMVDRSRETIRSKDGEIAVLQERVAQLADESLRFRRDHATSDEKMRLAVESLTALQDEHAKLVARTRGMAAETRPAPGTVGPDATLRGATASSSSWQGTNAMAPAGEPSTTLSTATQALAPTAPPATRMAAAEAASVRRQTMRRLLHIHCGTATTVTHASPPSHLLAPGEQEDTSGDTAIPVAALLFGTDMFGNAATSTRVAAGSFASAATASTLPSGMSLPPAERGHDLEALKGVGLLDLSGLDLGDEDVAVLVHTLSRVPLGVESPPNITSAYVPGTLNAPRPVLAVDLRGNRITDVGAVLLAQMLGGAPLPGTEGTSHVASRVALLDLRGNKLSHVGVRALAEALRGNTALRVQHVFVGGEGFVRALGTKAAVGAAGAVGIVGIYDLRGNTGESSGDPGARATELLGEVSAVAPGGMDVSKYRPETIERPPPPLPPAFLGGGGPAPHQAAPMRPQHASHPPPAAYPPTAPQAAPARQVQFAPPAAAPPPQSSFYGTDVGPGPSFLSEASTDSKWAQHPQEGADHLLAMAAADEFLGPVPAPKAAPKGKRRKSGSGKPKRAKPKRVGSADKHGRSTTKASPYGALPTIPPGSR